LLHSSFGPMLLVFLCLLAIIFAIQYLIRGVTDLKSHVGIKVTYVERNATDGSQVSIYGLIAQVAREAKSNILAVESYSQRSDWGWGAARMAEDPATLLARRQYFDTLMEKVHAKVEYVRIVQMWAGDDLQRKSKVDELYYAHVQHIVKARDSNSILKVGL